MIKLTTLFGISLMTISCIQGKNESNTNTKADGIPFSDSITTVDEKKRDFTKSKIINPNFDKELLFGVWGVSPDDPACEFEINENRLQLCDYDVRAYGSC